MQRDDEGARVLAAQVAIAVLVSSVAIARADISAAKTAWNDAEYERVVETTTVALAGTLPDGERVEALRLLGFALVILNRAPEAEAAFARIFSIAPDFALPPGTSPRFQKVFDPARARWQVEEQQRLATQLGSQLASLQLRVELPRAPRGGVPIAIAIELADPGRIANAIVLSHRRTGERYYTTATLPAKTGRSTLAIAGELTASRVPYTLELHVQVRHRSGVTLRHEGEPDRPVALSVAAGEVPTSTPITRRWWFWTGLGVVAIGTGLLVREVVDVGPQHVVIRP